MTRSEMVTEYNFWVRKRECYKEKIATNTNVRAVLSVCLNNCEISMSKLDAFSSASVLFEELYIKNNASYNSTKASNILAIIDEVGMHLETVKSNAQQQINYWYEKIAKYDAEKDATAQ